MNESRFKNKKLLIILLIAVLIITNVATFFITKLLTQVSSNAEVNKGLKKLGALESIIESDFYEDVDRQALLDGAIKGMFEALGDEYSEYYTAEEFDEILAETEGSYEGVGIVLTENDEGQAQALSIYVGSPAEAAGIQPGDIISKVDGEDVLEIGVTLVATKIRGAADTNVTITYLRDGVEKEVTLTRGVISVSSVESEMIGTIGYIDISEFIESTAEDFKTQLSALKAQGMTGLILDLRFNGGGLVDQAVGVCDDLLGQKLVVYTMNKAGEKKEEYADGEGELGLPMVVLVNAYTASASEIVTAALQDYGVATVVGTTTFGKGIVQEVVPLYDGSGFKLTYARYYTPKDTCLHEIGITPDVVLEQTEGYENTVTVPQDVDAQLQKALEILGK